MIALSVAVSDLGIIGESQICGESTIGGAAIGGRVHKE